MPQNNKTAKLQKEMAQGTRKAYASDQKRKTENLQKEMAQGTKNAYNDASERSGIAYATPKKGPTNMMGLPMLYTPKPGVVPDRIANYADAIAQNKNSTYPTRNPFFLDTAQTHFGKQAQEETQEQAKFYKEYPAARKRDLAEKADAARRNASKAASNGTFAGGTPRSTVSKLLKIK